MFRILNTHRWFFWVVATILIILLLTTIKIQRVDRYIISQIRSILNDLDSTSLKSDDITQTIKKKEILTFKNTLKRDDSRSIIGFDPITKKFTIRNLNTGSLEIRRINDIYYTESSDWGIQYPLVSTDGQKFANIVRNEGSVVEDIYGNTVILIPGFSNSVDVYNKSWSPDGSKLLFSITEPEILELPTIYPEIIPSEIEPGYYVADFNTGKISQFTLNGDTYSVNFTDSIAGWVDSDNLLLMRHFDKSVYALNYNLSNSELSFSDLLGNKGQLRAEFKLIGVTPNKDVVFFEYSDYYIPTSTINIKIWDGEKEIVVATSSKFAELQPNDISISTDGEFVYYSRNLSKKYFYNIETGETGEMK